MNANLSLSAINIQNIVQFYKKQIQDNKRLELKMLHFFINTGINDNAYYWNELVKCIKVYVSLKKECPTLDRLNIGGGFPIKVSGIGIVGVALVSGLPQVEDHKMIIKGLNNFKQAKN